MKMEQRIYGTPDQARKRIAYLKDVQIRDEECSCSRNDTKCTSGSIEEDINDTKYSLEEV